MVDFKKANSKLPVQTIEDETEFVVDLNGAGKGLSPLMFKLNQLLSEDTAPNALNVKAINLATGILNRLIPSSTDRSERLKYLTQAAKLLQYIGNNKGLKVSVIEADNTPQFQTVSIAAVTDAFLKAGFVVDVKNDDVNTVGDKLVLTKPGIGEIKVQRVNTWRLCDNVDNGSLYEEAFSVLKELLDTRSKDDANGNK